MLIINQLWIPSNHHVGWLNHHFPMVLLVFFLSPTGAPQIFGPRSRHGSLGESPGLRPGRRPHRRSAPAQPLGLWWDDAGGAVQRGSHGFSAKISGSLAGNVIEIGLLLIFLVWNHVGNLWGICVCHLFQQIEEEWHCLRQCRNSKLGCWLPVPLAWEVGKVRMAGKGWWMWISIDEYGERWGFGKGMLGEVDVLFPSHWHRNSWWTKQDCARL